MQRRRFLYTGAAVGALTVQAGCLVGDDDEDADEDQQETDDSRGFDAMPRVEDPPEAVYLPSHQDGMVVLDSVEAGELVISPMLSIPHFFWNVPGPEKVDPPSGDSIHLMATIWDPETGIVLPVDAGSTIELTTDGDLLSERSPWSMISQGMGFHLGDNYPIDGNGTYTATVSLSPINDVTLTGAFDGRFDESETVSFEFEIDDELRQTLVDRIELFDEDRWGDRGAVTPMGRGHGDGGHGDDDHENHEGDSNDSHGDDEDHEGHNDDSHAHEMPYSSLPPADDLPGQLLGEPTHDDGVYTTTLLSAGSRFVDGDKQYLVVSPRTPYNRCVLPHESLSMRLERDGETVVDSALSPTLDHELNYHYGVPIEDVQPGDELHLAVEAPQVTRHQGYETAFLSAGEITLEIEDI